MRHRFPFLEVLASDGPDVPKGHRVEILATPFVIGNEAQASFRPKVPRLAPRHCEIVYEYQRWWLRDLGSADGTLHCGARIHDAELLSGDIIELPGGLMLRFWLADYVEFREPTLEHALAASPDSAPLWNAYADWLEERGSPVGARILSPDPRENGRWLGPLASAAQHGEVQVRWLHGLASQVVLRRLSLAHRARPWLQSVELLVCAPEFRFVRRLEVDAASFEPGPLKLQWGLELINRLGETALPLLEHVSMGPGFLFSERALLEPLLARRRALCPHFHTTADSFFEPWYPARLVSPLQSIPLPLDQSYRGDAFEISFEDSRWRLDARGLTELWVNGHAASEVLLRSGDVIESAGVGCRFEAEPTGPAGAPIN